MLSINDTLNYYGGYFIVAFVVYNKADQHAGLWLSWCDQAPSRLYQTDPWLNGDKSSEAERGHDAGHMARNSSAFGQNQDAIGDLDERYGPVRQGRQRPWSFTQWSAHHGRSRSCTQPVMFLPAASTQISQSVFTAGRTYDFPSCLRHQLTWLLQQPARWYQLLHKLLLQVVQNAADRFVTGTTNYEHLTPVLHGRHWLPAQQRITFKVAVMMYNWLYGLAPPYHTKYRLPTSSDAGRRHLLSAAAGQLTVLRTRTI